MTLTFPGAGPAHGETVKLRYNHHVVSARRLKDTAGNEVAAFSDKAVTNNTPVEHTADGWTVVLNFSNPINTDPCALTSAFIITVDGSAYQPRATACNANYVRLTMPEYWTEVQPGYSRTYPVGAIHPGQTVTLSYDKSEATDSGSGQDFGAKLTAHGRHRGRQLYQYAGEQRDDVGGAGGSGDGRELSIQFDRDLDPNSRPPGENFKVETDPEGGPRGARGPYPAGVRGATARAASGGGAGRTIAGTGTASAW